MHADFQEAPKFSKIAFEYNYAADVELLTASIYDHRAHSEEEEPTPCLFLFHISLPPSNSEELIIAGRKSEIMPCFVPFNRSLDLTIFVMRSVSVLDDEIIHAMKCFSFQAEDLGCIYSSVMKSIHGNTIVWYGAWIKRSEEDRNILNATLLSDMEELSHLAVLLQHGFYDVYAGESKDGQPNAKFSSGNTVLLSGMVPASDDTSDLSDACMAILRSSFMNVEGATAGICLQRRDRPLVTMMHVWESLQACYSWLITSDYRRNIQPYLSCFIIEAQFDIFKVIYVNCDDALNFQISR